MRTFQKAGVAVAALCVPLFTLTACGSDESPSSETPTTTVTRSSSHPVKPSNTAQSSSSETQTPTQDTSSSEVPTVTVGSQSESHVGVTTVTKDGTVVTSTVRSHAPAEPSSLSTPSSHRAEDEHPVAESAQAAGQNGQPTTLTATTVVNANQESYTFTNPSCDGHYIVVVGNYVPTDSFDAAQLDELRAQYPGAMVAQSDPCGSLAGESYPIYFDYGWDGASACAQEIPGARPKVAGPAGSPNPCID